MATPADAQEPTWRALRPQVMILPERPLSATRRVIDRWAISYDGGKPESLPSPAIQAAVSSIVEKLYPSWRPKGPPWTPTALLIRHGVSAEELGLVEPQEMTGDAILQMIADDPAVRAAWQAEDPSLPSTTYELARARLSAQERRGIPPEKQVLMSSGQLEGLLVELLFNMDGDLLVINKYTGDRVPVLEALRQKLRPYRGLADLALMTALRDYPHPHPHIEKLREAAARSAAAA